MVPVDATEAKKNDGSLHENFSSPENDIMQKDECVHVVQIAWPLALHLLCVTRNTLQTRNI